MSTTTTPKPKAKRLSQIVRAAIIKDLVAWDEPADEEEAREFAVAWNGLTDYDLIETNNYNRTKRGLPPRNFTIGRRKRQ